MSDLLSLTDYHGNEFADRIAGLYQQCQYLSTRAADIASATTKRVDAMRRNTFAGLAEIGKALLKVQAEIPGDFGDWFEARRERIGFSLSTADHCKAAARLVEKHGEEAAFAIAASKSTERQEPILAATLRLTKPIDQLTQKECHQWRERIRPWVELDAKLAEREVVSL